MPSDRIHSSVLSDGTKLNPSIPMQIPKTDNQTNRQSASETDRFLSFKERLVWNHFWVTSLTSGTTNWPRKVQMAKRSDDIEKRLPECMSVDWLDPRSQLKQLNRCMFLLHQQKAKVSSPHQVGEDREPPWNKRSLGKCLGKSFKFSTLGLTNHKQMAPTIIATGLGNEWVRPGPVLANCSIPGIPRGLDKLEAQLLASSPKSLTRQRTIS